MYIHKQVQQTNSTADEIDEWKKSKVFEPQNMTKQKAGDDEYLLIKVTAIMRLHGACRCGWLKIGHNCLTD